MQSRNNIEKCVTVVKTRTSNCCYHCFKVLSKKESLSCNLCEIEHSKKCSKNLSCYCGDKCKRNDWENHNELCHEGDNNGFNAGEFLHYIFDANRICLGLRADGTLCMEETGKCKDHHYLCRVNPKGSGTYAVYTRFKYTGHGNELPADRTVVAFPVLMDIAGLPSSVLHILMYECNCYHENFWFELFRFMEYNDYSSQNAIDLLQAKIRELEIQYNKGKS